MPSERARQAWGSKDALARNSCQRNAPARKAGSPAQARALHAPGPSQGSQPADAAPPALHRPALNRRSVRTPAPTVARLMGISARAAPRSPVRGRTRMAIVIRKAPWQSSAQALGARRVLASSKRVTALPLNAASGSSIAVKHASPSMTRPERKRAGVKVSTSNRKPTGVAFGCKARASDGVRYASSRGGTTLSVAPRSSSESSSKTRRDGDSAAPAGATATCAFD